MKIILLTAAILPLALPALALDGQVGIHDPSTVIECDGKYYVWGTGGGGLVSDDGWTWARGTPLGRGGLAPDIIHVGDNYFAFTAANVGGEPAAEVYTMSNKTLDPSSPDFKWVQNGVAASSDGVEDCNAIDPGVFHDPTTGRLWLTYGSYIGYIRLVELDPSTGKRLHPGDKPVDLAVNCEASDMIYHDGWYYLFATHGSCCAGASSGYNIRMGRSRSVTGPFIDNKGTDMIQGGGAQFLGSEGRYVGPGHFGLLDLGDGVQKFSCHYEADLDRGGASVLDIRPVMWRDGWPVAGENLKEGTYEIQSLRAGNSLELAVEGVPVGGARRGGRGGGGRGGFGGLGGRRGGGAVDPNAATGQPSITGTNGPVAAPTVAPAAPRGGGGRGGQGGVIPPQDVAQVSTNWPTGNIEIRMDNYMDQAQQKWAITAVTNVGGYPGSPYFKITIAGTDRALAATPDLELVIVPEFTGAPEQLWRFDELADGSWRIMPKAVPGSKESAAVAAVGSGFATLSKFEPESDRYRWVLKAP